MEPPIKCTLNKGHLSIKLLLLDLNMGLFSLAYKHTSLSWQWLWQVKHVCKVSLSYEYSIVMG